VSDIKKLRKNKKSWRFRF